MSLYDLPSLRRQDQNWRSARVNPSGPVVKLLLNSLGIQGVMYIDDLVGALIRCCTHSIAIGDPPWSDPATPFLIDDGSVTVAILDVTQSGISRKYVDKVFMRTHRGDGVEKVTLLSRGGNHIVVVIGPRLDVLTSIQDALEILLDD
jgi:hypothetical protein